MTQPRIARTILAVAAGLLLVGCPSGDDDTDVVDAPDTIDTVADHGADAPSDGPDADAEAETEAEADAPEDVDPGPCDGMTDLNCIEIQVGERMLHRRLDGYATVEIDDEGTSRTCVALPDLIDADVTATPEDYRYQAYGTDGYTFGGYATWTNMLNGFIELGNRRIYWDPSQELPNSWNVRDSYLIVVSPATP